MKKTINVGFKRKKINLVVEDCNLFKKFSGLMFSRSENAKILLFDFRKKQNIAIHSFFVFYPFVAIWLDENDKIIKMKVVKPFNPYISSKKLAFKLIEIPINSKNKKILSLLHP